MRGLFVAVAVAVALLLPTTGRAHLEVTPALLESGQEIDLHVELPELRPGDPPTSLAVSGDGVRQLHSRAAGTFGRETRWQIRVSVRAEPGPTVLLLRAVFADGSTVDVRRTVTVVPAREDEDYLPIPAAAVAALGLAGLLAAAVFLRRQPGRSARSDR